MSKLTKQLTIDATPVGPLRALNMFLLKIRTLIAVSLEMHGPSSASLFWLKSRKCRFGRDTRFSIFKISLFCKFKYFTLSSPSRRGMCLRPLESNCIFSGF